LVGQKQDLLSSSKDIEAFLKKLGDSLIWEIQRKVSHMVTKVHTECSMRCRCLQDGMDELSAPQKVRIKTSSLQEYSSYSDPTGCTVPVKSLESVTHSRIFLYFYYCLHCKIIFKTSKL
jgi:hypothetical protein